MIHALAPLMEVAMKEIVSLLAKEIANAVTKEVTKYLGPKLGEAIGNEVGQFVDGMIKAFENSGSELPTMDGNPIGQEIAKVLGEGKELNPEEIQSIGKLLGEQIGKSLRVNLENAIGNMVDLNDVLGTSLDDDFNDVDIDVTRPDA